MTRGVTARRWTPDLSTFAEPVFAPYVTLIGQVALAWNDLHERLGMLFWSIMGGGFMERPIGIWNSANFDRARREMLRKAVEASTPRELDDFPKLRDDVVWMLNELDTLEQRRNDVVHSPLLTVRNMLAILTGALEPVISNNMLGNQRAVNIAERHLITDFTWCRDTILLWRDFAYSVDRALTAAGAPWPDRPFLPTRPHRRTQQLAKSRSSKKPRASPPQPSRE